MERIRTLDGFRAISIILVLLYHYFSRWIPPFPETYVSGFDTIYPYNDRLNFFGYGNSGVVFFFMISGFVIVMTLEKTETLGSFFKNRVIRLLPTMIIISVVTFGIFLLLGSDSPFYAKNTSLKNLATSITFVNPKIYNQFFHLNVDWLNGSYWSLWPEIQFYFLCGLLYFIFKSNKIEKIIIVFCALLVADSIINLEERYIHAKTLEHLIGVYHHETKLFNILAYLPSFAMGIIWYRVYKNPTLYKNTATIFAFLILLLFQLSSRPTYSEKLIYLSFNICFALMVFKSDWLAFLNNKSIQLFGIGSYALYLVHEQLGVALIHQLPANWPVVIYAIVVVALIVILGLLAYSYTSTVEKKIIKLIKNK